MNKQVCGNYYNYTYDGYVFVDEMGERMKPNYLTSAFPKSAIKCGLVKMRFHDLRHSCASLLIGRDAALLNVSNFLGHSDISTTANIYAHLDKASKQSSADIISDIFKEER